MPATVHVRIEHIGNDFLLAKLDHTAWRKAKPTKIDRYWSGETAPASRQVLARLLWSDTALYVQFEAFQSEPLVVSEKPDVTKKTIGLWDRDVCEIFIAPDKANRNNYFEFEVAPTGEWVDVGIQWAPEKRKTDMEYSSGMETAAFVEAEKAVMAIKIPWTAFGKTPKIGDVWLGNLFRCIGKGSTRGYLAWQPTKTSKPNFHVPAAFGKFLFVGAS